MSRSVARLIVETIKNAGVQRVYGLPGDSLNGLTDALRHDGEVGWQHVRHEEAAAFAAAGEAAITGQLAVCAGSCGPGNLHLINGLFDANRSRVPVLAIAAHIPSEEIGTTFFQETHPQELFRECSVYCELVSTSEQLPHVLNIAVRSAVEQRGVAVLVIPGEVFADSVSFNGPAATIRPSTPVMRPAESVLDAAADTLNRAARVTLFAGAGCAGAHDEVLALADAVKAPVVHTLRGKEWIEYDNPYDVGMTGLLGFASGYKAMERCDVLVMLGPAFPYRQFLPEAATVLQVDVRGEQIGRRTHVDLPLVGTVKDTIEALLPRLEKRADAKHLETMQHHYSKTRERLDGLADDDRDRTPMHPQLVASTLNTLAADDAVFLADVGTPTIWAARYLRMNGQRRLVGSFNHGSMANALPQALGVQAAQPDRQVITLSGDGGLAMLLGDMITLRQQHLPVKLVVFNNGALAFVELEMKASGFVTFATDLDDPDFVQIAEAIGLHAERVERADALESALRRALDHPGPALVEVIVQRHELSMPPTISADEIRGFSLWATRSVLSGRGDELIDIAKTNLLDRIFS